MLPDVYLTKDECGLLANFIWRWRKNFPTTLVLYAMNLIRHNYDEYERVGRFIVQVQMHDVEEAEFYRDRFNVIETVEKAIRRVHVSPLPAEAIY